MLYTYALTAIVAGAVAFGAAWQAQAWRFDSAQLAAQVNQRATERMRRQNANTAAVVHENEKVVIREKFVPIIQEVEKIVSRPVYTNICLDDDGLAVLQNAINSTNVSREQPPR